jgi:hypothetical protein
MMAREVSGRSYPEIGVTDGHHACSHHRNDPVKLELDNLGVPVDQFGDSSGGLEFLSGI